LPLLAAGCLQLDGELTIGTDQSASLQLSYTLGDQAMEQLRVAAAAADRLAKAAGEPVGPSADSAARVFGNPSEADIRNYMRSLSAYGIQCSEVRITSGGARRTVRMAVSFEDLARAARAPLLQAAGITFRKNEDGSFELKRVAQDNSGTNLLASAETVREVTPVFAGFRTNFRVKTLGRIMTTSARKHTQHSAVWEHDFNRTPSSVQDALSGEISVTYRNE